MKSGTSCCGKHCGTVVAANTNQVRQDDQHDDEFPTPSKIEMLLSERFQPQLRQHK